MFGIDDVQNNPKRNFMVSDSALNRAEGSTGQPSSSDGALICYAWPNCPYF
jgi:hypothetical protein